MRMVDPVCVSLPFNNMKTARYFSKVSLFGLFNGLSQNDQTDDSGERRGTNHGPSIRAGVNTDHNIHPSRPISPSCRGSLHTDNNSYHNEMEIGNSRPLVEDYIRYRLESNGLSWPNGQSSDVTPNETQSAMRDLGDEFETRFSGQAFDDMVNQLHITIDTAHQTFTTIVNEIFGDGVNWGRIVALFGFSGKLAVRCVQQSMPQLVNSLVDWVSAYVDTTLKTWLTENNGWVGFLEFYEGGPEKRSKESWPSFKKICSIAAAGLGILTLGAILTQKT